MLETMKELPESATVIAAESALATTIDGEAVILESDSGMYYGLNEVATHIWDRIQERETVGSLRDDLTEQYDVPPAQCERDLETVLTTMQTKGLVTLEGT